jgi:multiple antibiotic resistance protein
VLLNPFIMSIYLIELVRDLEIRTFARQLFRASAISLLAFLLFAWAGDVIFKDVMQVRFISFLIFGGIIFLIIGARWIIGVAPPVEAPKQDTEQISGAIAMPFIVGPGTISASVLAGSRLQPLLAGAAIALAVALAVVTIILFKWLHDLVRKRDERLVKRYVEVAGRVTALFTGSFAVEMILTGLERWLASMPST